MTNHTRASTRRSTIKRWLLRDIPLILAVYLVIQTWQSRDLVDQSLPAQLQQRSLPTLTGGVATIGSHQSMSLIYLFAPWCEICKLSAANLNEWANQDLKVQSIALSWQERSEVEAFKNNSDLNTDILLGGDLEISELGVRVFPSYLIIDQNGQVILSWTGYTSKAGLFLRLWWARLSLAF